ncbi:MAG: filamentous hemagglutinin N-terminal domain-containing protein, partial [Cyanobacteria bacterium J06627_8]
MEQVQHRVSSPVRSIRLWVLLARVFLPAGAAVLSMLWVVESPAQIRARQGRNNTRVNREAVSNRGRFRERLLIDGGIRSSDRQNLFHSFEEFGLSTHQIATFLADPEIRNILGRVVGGHPSMIDGLIEVSGSDANLYLLNPAGIVFGPNSQLNVSGDFTATTATGIGFGDGWFDVGGDGDYSALVGDPTSFVFAVDEPGAIVNAGTLSVSTGSALTLLGGTVINTGTLTAPGGTITIAAIPGDRLVRIHQAGMLLSLDIATLDEGIPSNTARPAALPFTPLALPQLLTGDEVRSATSVRMNADGTVTLAGSGLGVPTQPGTAIASGRLDTSIQADSIQSGDGGIGPQINVLGDRVALLDATVDASSSATPGLIQVGGGYQGNGPVPNAELTYVDAGTVLRADGVQVDHDSGHAIDGGQIVAWADGTTQFYGRAIARGAGVEGRGGQVEISGSRSLAFDGLVDVSSSDGPDGTVLFDPADIIITDLTPLDDNQLSPNVPNAGDPAGIVLFNDQPTEAFTISSAAIAGLTGTVQLQAHSDIKIESVLQSSTIDTLILQAGRSIQADEPIILTNGSVVARINDERANPSFRAPGDAEFRIDAELNGAIVTTNGDITVDVGTFGGTPIGAVTLSETAILTRNGSISITGVGGTGGDGSNPGIVVDGTLIQALDSGSVTLRGTAGGTSGDISNAGVLITERSVVEASGTADITINGISGNAASNNIGVELEGVLTAGGGDISVIGTSDNQGLGGIDNYGILLEGGTIKNTGLGAVTLDGTVGAGSSGTINNSGIALLAGESGGSVIDIEDGGSVIDVEDGGSAINVESGSSVIEVENGILSLNGRTQARATDNHGIVIRDGSQLIGDRSITLTGDAPADAGIALDNGIIDAGTRATAEVTLTADTLDASVDSQIRGTGQLTIQPLTRNQRIQVGGVEGDRFAPVVTDRLLLSDRDLAALPNGFSQVTIGRTDGSGLVTVDGDVTFDDPTVLRSPTGPGSIDTTGGTINLADNASLSLIANRDVVTGDISAPGRSLSITSLNGRVDTNRGVLDTSAINGGGDIQIDAAQTITLGELSTSSVARDNDERSRLDANNAGNISIASSSGTVRVNGAITAIADAEGNAGNGGRIEIQAADSILPGGSAVLATSTRAEQGNAGDGGPIRLSADNTIRMNTRLESSAIAESFGSSGRGGRIRLSAGRRIVLEEGADSSTAAQQGTGGRGDIRLTADRDIIVNGPLTTSATSAAGLSDRGGAIRIRAGRDITLNGLDTSAEIVSPGGAVNIESTAGTVTLNSDVPITASETRTGGSTTINGAEGVRIALTPTDVNGPSPVLSRVTTGGRRFVVRSENGSVDLRASEPIAIATEGGRIRLQ